MQGRACLTSIVLLLLTTTECMIIKPMEKYRPVDYPNNGLLHYWNECSVLDPTMLEQRLNRSLRRISQQDAALAEVKRVLILYYNEKSSGATAPSLHLIGPCGEGKTTVSELIGEAISLKTSDNERPCGLIRHYIPSNGIDMWKPLSKQLINYFKNNPRRVGVVVIDDVSKINRQDIDPAHKIHVVNVIRRLVEHEDVLDTDGRPVSIKNAIVILTSDFGNRKDYEDDDDVEPDTPAEDYLRIIRRRCEKLARIDEQIFSNDHRLAGGTKKIPFDPLMDHNDFIKIVMNYLRQKAAKLDVTIDVDADSLKQYVLLSTPVAPAGERYPLGGGRMVQNDVIAHLNIPPHPKTGTKLVLTFKGNKCTSIWFDANGKKADNDADSEEEL
eukprot:TRINITY_DN1850_c5_g1_i1.p1 TRINITY_DN1850_c5_g1~~TRINITY_DN1850_c5_g1_i1.p1  ORF type:complete len:385 (+),score=45.41 TRINITY_DN1850_c5_g1_i1:66-1220(+)